MGLKNINYQSPSYKMLNIDNPCKGGLNIHDLDYKLDINQSPEVLNMMYRNGVFGKRFGQKVYKTYTNEVKNIIYYKNSLIAHSGEYIYKNEVALKNVGSDRGQFFKFNKILYYINSQGYYQYDGTTFKEVEPYVPDVIINRSPSGSTIGNTTEDKMNALGSAFNTIFDGDGTSKNYVLYDFEKEYDDTTPKCVVDTTTGEQEIAVTSWNKSTRTLVLASAPPKGTNNVHITAYLTDTEVRNRILKCKYSCPYGGDNSSRLFLGGNGDSYVFYSDVFDATYFPEPNYFRIGNTEEDVTGFGTQYNVLMCFKPREIYSFAYYTDEDGYGQFNVKLVNNQIGCDAPNSIATINNSLTWFNSAFGVCTLASSFISDERNVRRISRNIEGDNRVNGILEEYNSKNAVGYDYDNKYFLCFESGIAYVWDYYSTPYSTNLTSTEEYRTNKLAWYKFDNFFAKGFTSFEDKFFWFNGKNVIERSNVFNDFGQPINAIYKTPLIEFGATNYLKNIKNIFIQNRGDAYSRITLSYKTPDESTKENEEIVCNPNNKLWKKFAWSEFAYSLTSSSKITRIKASIKKVQALQLIFDNNKINNDLSITNLGMDYYIVREVK